MAASPKDHIQEIRRNKFSIGGETNPLTEDLHQAVKNLSAELYSKDVHFLMELIQNAEDNEYDEGVDPSLEFVITSKDITETGAQATLLIFNNEKGFSRKNVDSICSVGRSTKKGNRKSGYIGEKGIGFKSVFLITAQPYIFSNGYQIRFNEEPCSHCNVGYIVPEWVDENPILASIKQIYGSSKSLPTTTIVLPLKAEKVKPVKQQLSCIHPELLLFLSKIRQLSVREDNEDLRLNTVSSVSISSERDLVKKKNIDAESYLLVLSADEKLGKAGQCSYHMWRQRFPVRQEHKVDRRSDVDEWVITLAFPYGERLNRGNSSPGIYAFLPTEMVTNFPFIIQADFLLSSSREAILLDDKWNQGILNCVPLAFLSAFTSLVKANEDAPVSSLINMFSFLPVSSSSFSSLNSIRDSIKEKMLQEDIVPCQSYTKQKFFRKPCQVGRLKPALWNLLNKARKEGVTLHNISSHGRDILNVAFDQEEYNYILDFLEVKHVDDEWYSKCIQSSDLVSGVSEDLYLELLLFVADNWGSFSRTNMVNIPLLKYVDSNGHEALCSAYYVSKGYIALLLSSGSKQISWLTSWNQEFRCEKGYFIAESTQEAFLSCSSKWQKVFNWLCSPNVNVSCVDVHDYAVRICGSLCSDQKLVIAYAHFLYHSFRRDYLSGTQISSLCRVMPLVNDYGLVATQSEGVVVPANGSKWVELIGSNPWKSEGLIELGEDYLHSRRYADVSTKKEELLYFLRSYAGAMDIPKLPPPNAALSSMSSPLTRENAFLLLNWISNMRVKRISMPERFMTCIREGSWLKVLICGSPGYKPPSQSFFHSSSWGHHLQNGSVHVDIPLVDQEFYGADIVNYQEELKMAGVMFEFKEACQFIGKHFMSLAASYDLTKYDVFSILNFIRYLREKYFSPDDFINSIKHSSWLQTTQGKRTPGQSVFFDKEWSAASQISDIAFVDHNHYGENIVAFKEELRLLGVVFGFNQNFQLVLYNLKPSERLISLNAEAALLALDCIRHHNSNYSDRLCRTLKANRWLKTVNKGFASPAECFLPDSEWGCLLQVFDSFLVIDEKYYGNRISLFKNELNNLGVVIRFDDVVKPFAQVFRQQTSRCALSKRNALSFLECFRKLKVAGFNLQSKDIMKCIQDVKWLRTRLSTSSTPKECILFGGDSGEGWEPISSVSLLPFLDDAYYGQGIQKYKDELFSMGVTTTFRKCAKFVPARIRLPQNPSGISCSAAFALLLCMRNLQKDCDDELISALRDKLNQKWVKTQAGYRCPKECLLFDPNWNDVLKQEDAPFIDEQFYGQNILSYKKELEALGVVVEVKKGCSVVDDYLYEHSNRTTINRIYTYLCKYRWPTSTDVNAKIWIPNGENSGKWETPQNCVLHDKNDLFGSELYVLEKYYSKEILSYFARLGVKSNPDLEDYFKLWKAWESAERRLSPSECCAFWEFVVRHWGLKTQKFLAENLSKLPVCSGPDGILLLDKCDVFIPDDLYIKDLFEKSCGHPLFVWYPQPSMPSLPRTKLLSIYRELGARALSESVQNKGIFSIDCAGLEKANPEMIFIGKNIFRLILGFLAQSSLEIEAEKRHESLRCLVNTSFLKTEQPITIEYRLSLSSDKILRAKASRMMRWDRESSKFFITELAESNGYKGILEYATYYSQVVSEGILWEKEDQVCELAELIKLGYMVKFDEEAISFLMKTKNLQIFLEDEQFLSSVFPAE